MCDSLLKNIGDGKLNCLVLLDYRKALIPWINKMRNLFGVTGNQL